jgi:hypothetical protein
MPRVIGSYCRRPAVSKKRLVPTQTRLPQALRGRRKVVPPGQFDISSIMSIFADASPALQGETISR